ncbi:MAG: hypothetical protein CO028_04095 [Candidatus Levybacteria bacterium CG_4_9_14_0_2_um_filter_35_21]|nr:MAG: hypothetical protein COW87_02685 [Candidatus Levybacteria bacterium CG22_combo_CG10-13_8_21_14_all_35_11]PJC54118.1 MAG: hypothetical protein CO028_04095 [Candidatus Levybacteria bacterium CG_4_9_14_0_2_um_filter_35_21]
MIKFQKKTVVLFVSFLLVVVFTRFYNLAGTARFTQDESSDLARMNEYYQNKQISLVGPISSDRSKVFSSLGYYMLMPFTVAFNFTPVSPVYGMAFLGTLTAVFMLFIARSVNKRKTILAGTLIMIWFPLVLVSRWAWNPHFVIFWASFALLIYQYRARIGSWAYLLIGLFFGFMFHHHYVALLTTAPFLLFISIPLLKKKEFKPVILLALGYLLPHLIFLLFDLKNPPGLFFGRYLTGGNTPHIETELTLLAAWNNLARNISVYLGAFIENSFLKTLFGFSMLSLIILELKKNFYRTITWVIPSTAIIFGGIFLDDFQIRYIFSSTAFVFVWLLFSRKEKRSKFLANFCILVLILGSLLSIKSQLTFSEVTPNMGIFTKASQIIIDTVAEHKLNNSNVAALSSSDDAPLAERYRDYVRMKHTGLRAESEYDVSEHLFVISTANDEILRADKSYAMVAFKDKVLRGVFDIEDTEWKVFWYGTK